MTENAKPVTLLGMDRVPFPPPMFTGESVSFAWREGYYASINGALPSWDRETRAEHLAYCFGYASGTCKLFPKT